jgi:hypothetical protein
MLNHTIIDTLTGANGRFCFSDILFDNYVVEVVHDDTLGSVRQVQIAEYDPKDTLNDIQVMPMAKLSGNVNLYSNDTTFSVMIQVYGVDRYAYADNIGTFSLVIPGGLQKVHIAAYAKEETGRSVEFDGVDISFHVIPVKIVRLVLSIFVYTHPVLMGGVIRWLPDSYSIIPGTEMSRWTR